MPRHEIVVMECIKTDGVLDYDSCLPHRPEDDTQTILPNAYEFEDQVDFEFSSLATFPSQVSAAGIAGPSLLVGLSMLDTYGATSVIHPTPYSSYDTPPALTHAQIAYAAMAVGKAAHIAYSIFTNGNQALVDRNAALGDRIRRDLKILNSASSVLSQLRLKSGSDHPTLLTATAQAPNPRILDPKTQAEVKSIAEVQRDFNK